MQLRNWMRTLGGFWEEEDHYEKRLEGNEGGLFLWRISHAERLAVDELRKLGKRKLELRWSTVVRIYLQRIVGEDFT